MSRGSLSVTFKDGEVWAPAHLNQASVAFLLMQLFRHNFLINDRLVFPSLDIEKATWARVDSTPATKKKRKVHMYRIRAKGLAMEVLCGLLLAGLDSPEWVRNHAKARGGLPFLLCGCEAVGHRGELSGRPQARTLQNRRGGQREARGDKEVLPQATGTRRGGTPTNSPKSSGSRASTRMCTRS